MVALLTTCVDLIWREWVERLKIHTFFFVVTIIFNFCLYSPLAYDILVVVCED
jgi:hypothetical protein